MGLGHLRNSLVASSDAVVAIGGGAGTLAELAFAWIRLRLIVALRADGFGRPADQRVDNVVRHAAIKDDRIFGANGGCCDREQPRRCLPRLARRSHLFAAPRLFPPRPTAKNWEQKR